MNRKLCPVCKEEPAEGEAASVQLGMSVGEVYREARKHREESVRRVVCPRRREPPQAAPQVLQERLLTIEEDGARCGGGVACAAASVSNSYAHRHAGTGSGASAQRAMGYRRAATLRWKPAATAHPRRSHALRVQRIHSFRLSIPTICDSVMAAGIKDRLDGFPRFQNPPG